MLENVVDCLALSASASRSFPVGDATDCEYGRCGGLGRREVKRKRLARLVVTVQGKLWRVCESCADLLIREVRKEGRSVEREPFEAR